MKKPCLLLTAFTTVCILTGLVAPRPSHSETASLPVFAADNPNIQYVGRIDFTDPKKPRFWSPGVYIRAKFTGTECDVLLNDQVLWGSSHNYVEAQIDDWAPMRMQTTGATNKLTFDGLAAGAHTITIVKDTESGIGYLEFVGLSCRNLLPPDPLPTRKIEFIGDSITAGGDDDTRTVPCGKGQWYDPNNAYLTYGPETAQAVDAQWMLSAVSGIGMIHSCCNMTETMPAVYDTIDTRAGTAAWDFSRYQPDVVTICLGQNDGAQKPEDFCAAYVNFIKVVRGHYPKAVIVCLNSPMADDNLTTFLKANITKVVDQVNQGGDKDVHAFFFSRSWHGGCVGHPDLAGHKAISGELTTELKSLMGW